MQIGFSISRRTRGENAHARDVTLNTARVNQSNPFNRSDSPHSLSLTDEMRTVGVQLQLVLMAFTKRRQPLRDQCSALNLLIQRLGSFWQEFVCSPHACKHCKLKCGAKRSVFSIRRSSCTSTVNRRISRRS